MAKRPKYTKYCQCILKKDDPPGYLQMVSWIPQQYAQIGKVIKLKNNDDDTWNDGWTVIANSDPISEEKLANYHRDVKWHLKNTGDIVSPTNLPK